MSRNSNCLENMRCPKCGNTSRFKIVALITADVTDGGAEFHGDAAWDDTSGITCPECDRSGKVADFRCRTFNVHIYREMRLRFDAVSAASHESAAKFAELMPASAATLVEDCEGESLYALVDVVGDDDFGQSRSIDFETGRKLTLYNALVDALLNIKRLAEKSGDEETVAFVLLDLIAHEARAAINNVTQE